MPYTRGNFQKVTSRPETVKSLPLTELVAAGDIARSTKISEVNETGWKLPWDFSNNSNSNPSDHSYQQKVREPEKWFPRQVLGSDNKLRYSFTPPKVSDSCLKFLEDYSKNNGASTSEYCDDKMGVKGSGKNLDKKNGGDKNVKLSTDLSVLDLQYELEEGPDNAISSLDNFTNMNELDEKIEKMPNFGESQSENFDRSIHRGLLNVQYELEEESGSDGDNETVPVPTSASVATGQREDNSVGNDSNQDSNDKREGEDESISQSTELNLLSVKQEVDENSGQEMSSMETFTNLNESNKNTDETTNCVPITSEKLNLLVNSGVLIVKTEAAEESNFGITTGKTSANVRNVGNTEPPPNKVMKLGSWSNEHRFRCTIPNCKNNRKSDKAKGVEREYYGYPLKDPARLKLWLGAIPKDFGWRPTRYHKVCSDHFEGGNNFISSYRRLSLG